MRADGAFRVHRDSFQISQCFMKLCILTAGHKCCNELGRLVLFLLHVSLMVLNICNARRSVVRRAQHSLR